MKVNRPNQIDFNPYKKHLQKQAELKKTANKSDELQISKEAFKLQQKEKSTESREAYVEKIKQAVDSGQYKVDLKRTASKMLDFWSGK